MLFLPIPGKSISIRGVHPITQISWKIVKILKSIGFNFVDSPEVDTAENCFDCLNINISHPARTSQDTFYFSETLLLRTHTSNTQSIIYKEFVNIDLNIVTVGKVYRRDVDDAVHSHQFTQAECFSIGKKVSFANLKKTLDFFLREIFGEDVVYRFRSSYFPFTVPSVEVDIQCFKCLGKEKVCSLCKNSGWIEILGAGLVNPIVLKNCGYSEEFSGFAFGVGVERLLMLKYGIDDIRDLYKNDLRFLKQFVFFN